MLHKNIIYFTNKYLSESIPYLVVDLMKNNSFSKKPEFSAINTTDIMSKGNRRKCKVYVRMMREQSLDKEKQSNMAINNAMCVCYVILKHLLGNQLFLGIRMATIFLYIPWILGCMWLEIGRETVLFGLCRFSILNCLAADDRHAVRL